MCNLKTEKRKNGKTKERFLVFKFLSFLVFCIFITGCEQVDTESLNRITQDDPSFKDTLANKQKLDLEIGRLLSQLREIKAVTYTKIRAIQEEFEKQKNEISAKINVLKNELEPVRFKIRQDMEALRSALSSKKEVLKNLENTKRNLTNLINQQKAVSVTREDMAKWQERLSDLDREIGPLAGEVREMEERLHLLRLKLIALKQ